MKIVVGTLASILLILLIFGIWPWATAGISRQDVAEFFRPPTIFQREAAATAEVQVEATRVAELELLPTSTPTETPLPISTPRPTSTPQPFPTPTKVVETGFSLEQGDIVDVNAGKGCFGDLDLWTGNDWYSPYLYENDLDNTGQIVIFTADSKVKAAYPGSCTPWGDVDTMSNSIRQNGCINGCKFVNVVYWP